MTMTVHEIAAKIHAECMGIAGDKALQAQAQDDLSLATTKLNNTRLDVCSNVAKLSETHDWDELSIDQAVKMAQAQPSSNNAQTAKAIAVFCSQVKACALPRVRARFGQLRNVIETAWDNEADAVASTPKGEAKPATPLRKFVSRKYELILRACRDINAGANLTLSTPDDVRAWAIANDPDQDAERIAKRIRALANQLHEFYAEFPHANIDAAKQFIASIKATDLIAAKNAKNTKPVTHAAPAGATLVSPAHAPTPIPAQAPAREATTVPTPLPAQPVEGVYDYNDDIVAQALNNLAKPALLTPTLAQAA